MNSVKIDVFGETQLLAGKPTTKIQNINHDGPFLSMPLGLACPLPSLHIPFVSTQNNKFVAEA